jgi:hypothetical protein
MNTLLTFAMALGLAPTTTPMLVQSAPPQNSMTITIPCAPREMVLKTFKEQHNEEPVSVGISTDGSLAFEVFLSPEGKTFTIFVSRSDGISCSLGAGVQWEHGETPVAGQDS